MKFIKSKHKENYNASMDFLDYNFPLFFSFVVNLGTPIWTNDSTKVPTAAVDFGGNARDIKKGWKYYLNAEFANKISPEQLAFVSGHEALHIALDQNYFYNDNKSYFTDFVRFNIAADCIVNDILLDLGFDRLELKGLGENGNDANVYYGQDVVGYSTERVGLHDVYDDIPDEVVEKQRKQQEEQGVGEDEYEAGTGSGSFTNKPGKSTDKEGNVLGQNLPKSDERDAHKIQVAKNKSEENSKDAGSSFSIEVYNKQLAKASKGWKELLKVVNPNITKSRGPVIKPSFHERPRKMAGMSDPYGMNGVLPVRIKKVDKGGDKPTLVMFMDCSGSCTNYVPSFLTLANSVPRDDINLIVYTFSTYTMRFDLDADQQEYASGGTYFSPIEQAVQDEVVPEIGSYPKSVIVVTDGEAGFHNQIPSEENKDKWHWLILKDAYYGGAGTPGPFGHNHDFEKIFGDMIIEEGTPTFNG